MKETLPQLLAALKLGTRGNTASQSTHGRKIKMNDSLGNRTDTSDGDTSKEKRARKSQTGKGIFKIRK